MLLPLLLLLLELQHTPPPSRIKMAAPQWSDYVAWLMSSNNVTTALICNKDDGSASLLLLPPLSVCLSRNELTRRAPPALWASSSENFVFKNYKDLVPQEDGSEKEEMIDEEEGMLEFAKTLKKSRFGFRIAETKYMPLRTYPKGSNDNGCPTVVLKKKSGGGCVCVTDRAIVIGVWEEGQQAAACNEIVEKVANHLKSMKF